MNSVPLSAVIVCVISLSGCNSDIVASLVISACLEPKFFISKNLLALSTIVSIAPLWSIIPQENKNEKIRFLFLKS